MKIADASEGREREKAGVQICLPAEDSWWWNGSGCVPKRLGFDYCAPGRK